MFGYVTFNVKYYILSQIFYKKFGWVCAQVLFQVVVPNFRRYYVADKISNFGTKSLFNENYNFVISLLFFAGVHNNFQMILGLFTLWHNTKYISNSNCISVTSTLLCRLSVFDFYNEILWKNLDIKRIIIDSWIRFFLQKTYGTIVYWWRTLCWGKNTYFQASFFFLA